jgi:hypothetical protein
MLTICALQTWTLRLGHDKRYGKWIPQRPQQRLQKAAHHGELLSATSATRRGTRERECEGSIDSDQVMGMDNEIINMSDSG